MFYFYVTARKIEIKKSDTLVSDSINVYPCKFRFSEDWNGLVKTAVFRAGTNAIEILLDENYECNIPWEVLLKHKIDLFVGCYGTKGEDIILNTTWTNVGPIYEGTKNKAVPGETPTPDIISQITSQIGDLSSLETEDKSSLVNAINEVWNNTESFNNFKEIIEDYINNFAFELAGKVDKTGDVVTGPIMFSDSNSVMSYTFEDELIEDEHQGVVVSATGILKNSDGPLNISTTAQEVVFGHGTKLFGVVGDESISTSVPNMGQINKKVNDLKNYVDTTVGNIEVNIATDEEVNQMLNDVFS